ncbi:MAG TPA: hypothetical protein VFE30_14340 [Anaeromyxobacteraceae bacterium]|nr:hypothetical protein [Anaeromyxobacteraceae bacterium]
MPIRTLVLAAVALAAAAGCSHDRSESPPSAAVLPRPIGGSPDQPPVAPLLPGSVQRGERARCIDQELQRRSLNEYGDPAGTVYAAGSPLFNAVTGVTADRYDFVARRHPDIGTRCGLNPLELGR